MCIAVTYTILEDMERGLVECYRGGTHEGWGDTIQFVASVTPCNLINLISQNPRECPHLKPLNVIQTLSATN